MLDVIVCWHTWNCQILTHIHTKIHTHTHTLSLPLSNQISPGSTRFARAMGVFCAWKGCQTGPFGVLCESWRNVWNKNQFSLSWLNSIFVHLPGWLSSTRICRQESSWTRSPRILQEKRVDPTISKVKGLAPQVEVKGLTPQQGF